MHAGRVHLQEKVQTSLRKIHYIAISCLLVGSFALIYTTKFFALKQLKNKKAHRRHKNVYIFLVSVVFFIRIMN